MYLITSQISPREFTLKKPGWINLDNNDSIGFSCSKEAFPTTSPPVRSFPIITHTINISPSLIFSYYAQICSRYIELFSHQIHGGYEAFSHQSAGLA